MKLYIEFFKEGFSYLLKKLLTLFIAFSTVYTAPVDPSLSTRKAKTIIVEHQEFPYIAPANTNRNFAHGNRLAF